MGEFKKEVSSIMRRLERLANSRNVDGMARFGINVRHALGVPMPHLRSIAAEVGKDQRLSLKLWKTKIHEARILAALIGDPSLVTERQMETWGSDFDSWDICDQVCSNLFDRTPFAVKKSKEWSRRDEEFVKRGGFVLMAAMAVHDKKASDDDFIPFLTIIKREAVDDRNFVKKAVNWALRQIGKRSPGLNRASVRTAKEISEIGSRTARWIASDALRELTGDAVAKRFGRSNSVAPSPARNRRQPGGGDSGKS